MLKWVRNKLRDRNLGLHKGPFLKVLRKHKDLMTTSEGAAITCSIEFRVMINSGTLDPASLIKDALSYSISRALDSETSAHKLDTIRHLLIRIVDIAASFEMENRRLLRHLLKTIFVFSRCVDREVFLFEEGSSLSYTDINLDNVRSKLDYILRKTAGWRISHLQPPWNSAVCNMNPAYYLELAIPGANGGFTTLMSDALYRLQDPDLILQLIRYGVRPNPFYLWPIAIQTDLKHILSPENDFQLPGDSFEVNVVKYFCRARAGYRRILLHRTLPSNRLLNSGSSTANLFVMPASTAYLIPDDWCVNPCPLMHYCRLVIRSQLCKCDTLPSGIECLPIPSILKQYVDCLLD